MSVTNLMLIRNWVSEDRRRAIDAIIRAARTVGSLPEKRPAVQVRGLLMSERDGAGAQSIFASIKQGKDRIAAIIEKVLEPKRAYWASVIAWSAFAQRGDGHDSDWIEMALVAREMASERPLTEIPLARLIAVQTAEAART